MTCEKSWLRDMSKMWKMHYIGTASNRRENFLRIENAVKDSKYADITKRNWFREIEKWQTNYDATGSIYL